MTMGNRDDDTPWLMSLDFNVNSVAEIVQLVSRLHSVTTASPSEDNETLP